MNRKPETARLGRPLADDSQNAVCKESVNSIEERLPFSREVCKMVKNCEMNGNIVEAMVWHRRFRI